MAVIIVVADNNTIETTETIENVNALILNARTLYGYFNIEGVWNKGEADEFTGFIRVNVNQVIAFY